MQVEDVYYPKVHAIFEKDVFRLMKTDKIIQKSDLVKKTAGERSLLEYNNNKYKTKSQIIMQEYEKPLITEDRLYLIDKVVRIRGNNGRFGVDHSEILNYELELANKQRDEHMNQLVYKNPNPYKDQSSQPVQGFTLPGGDLQTSQILFRRLATKGQIQESSRCSLLSQKNRAGSARTVLTNRNAPTFQQWVRVKDAEKRLKKKLIQETKREIRQELLEYAKKEKLIHDSRVNQMESWLIKRKLNEAYNITQLRDTKKQQDIEMEAKNELNQGKKIKNYKMWLTQTKNQEKYRQMERALIAQMHAENAQMEKAKQGIQRQMQESPGQDYDRNDNMGYDQSDDGGDYGNEDN